jgi:hypothetical protein
MPFKMQANLNTYSSDDQLDHAYQTFSAIDFAHIFGTIEEEIYSSCNGSLAEKDWRYRPFSGKERDAVLLQVLKRIEKDRQVIGAPERSGAWEKGWSENLQDFVGGNGELAAITPKFIRPCQIVRLKQEYVQTASSNFERDFIDVLRDWVFRHYFSKYDAIYEFGSGSGFNLVALARLFPDKEIVGSDFVPSSCNLINEIAKRHKLHLQGFLFDMIHPDSAFQIKPESAVFTSGAIEQLAGRFESFLQFLIKKTPSVCLHIEPVVELYDPENLEDHMAITFHRKRGYTEGLLPRLVELDTLGTVELLNVKRIYFGSMMMEGYNLIAWRPIP